MFERKKQQKQRFWRTWRCPHDPAGRHVMDHAEGAIFGEMVEMAEQLQYLLRLVRGREEPTKLQREMTRRLEQELNQSQPSLQRIKYELRREVNSERAAERGLLPRYLIHKR